LLGHGGALDVPPGTARTPRRIPRSVLGRLLRLPEREVALIPLQVARLLRDHVFEPGTGQPSVARELRDAEVDVPVRDVRCAALDQRTDELDDLVDRLGRAGL